jgi:hypothetical protein
MHVPSTISKVGDFLTRPEVNMALGMMAPDIGALAWKPSMAMGGVAKGVGSKLGQAVSGLSTQFQNLIRSLHIQRPQRSPCRLSQQKTRSRNRQISSASFSIERSHEFLVRTLVLLARQPMNLCALAHEDEALGSILAWEPPACVDCYR